MKKQGMKTPKKLFNSWQAAYEYGIGKWGSGTFNIFYKGEPIGWNVTV